MSGLEIYRAILVDIRRHGYNVFTRRSGTTRLQKLALVAKSRLAVYRLVGEQVTLSGNV
jgi:hypothetical protein